MAKKPKSINNFYEQLPALAQSLDGFQIDYIALAKRAKPLFEAGLDFGQSLLEDIGYTIYRGARSLRVFRKQGIKKTILLMAIAGATGGVAAAGALAASTVSTYTADLVNPQALMNRNRVGTTILDRKGRVLYRAEGADNRIELKFADVPKRFVDATLAAEDPEFYQHDGVSFKSTARALWRDVVTGEKVEGGSTLSQQLIKNTLLTPKKSFKRKYQELVLALMLERHYSKDQILELYFNEVFYGQGSRGAERAAQTYFHKHLSQLSLGQSAMLAGLPLGPSRFDPNFDPEAAQARRDFVLHRMEELGQITAKQEATAIAESVSAHAQQIEIRAPHFVFYVLEQLRERYGQEVVSSGGITVNTTLDLDKQKIGEEEVRNQIARLQYQHVSNGGLVALDPRNGDVLAMVGSVDFNNAQFGKVNVTLSRLQPGSSFKPFAYATAFRKGYNGATQVQDRPMSVPDGSGQMYKPVNYDGKFRGPVLLRRALSNSLNIPAVKVIQFAGVDDTLKTAKDMGLTFLGPNSRFGLSLVLGSAEVKPLELAEGYATFANLGTKVNSRAITSVNDRYGEDITKTEDAKSIKALDPRIAYMIINILSDNIARQEIFGAHSVLELPRPAFVKTGTTNDFRDNFTAGSTPNLTTVVWVGNNDHTPMIGVSGITGAAPIWHNFMIRALGNSPALSFTQPKGLVTATVCTRDGGLANPWDAKVSELFLSQFKPTKRCSSAKPKPKPKKKAKPTIQIETSPETTPEDPDTDS